MFLEREARARCKDQRGRYLGTPAERELEITPK